MISQCTDRAWHPQPRLHAKNIILVYHARQLQCIQQAKISLTLPKFYSIQTITTVKLLLEHLELLPQVFGTICHSLYVPINAGVISETYEDMAMGKWQIHRFQRPHSGLTMPRQETPLNIYK